jgi:drug/metabolite transporter (DMT)-like permease
MQSNRSNRSATSSFRDHYDAMKGLIFGFLTATSAGIMIDIIKVLLSEIHINEFELIYIRSFFALLIVSVILWFNKCSIFAIDKDLALFAFGRVFGSCLGFALEIFSLDYITTSKSILIINNPLITSLLSYVLLREKSGLHDMISFTFCTLGVALLTNPFAEGGNQPMGN